MKVFINKREGAYSGGMVIVAANTVDEAQTILFQAFPDEITMYDEDGDWCWEESECKTKEHWRYKSRNWMELFGVTAVFDIPTFIAEDGYSE